MMEYGTVSSDQTHLPRSQSESSDASFEIVYSESTKDPDNSISYFQPYVKFHDIFDVYPMDTDLVARISHNENFEMSPDDTVIILPLAWTSMEQAVCSSKLNGYYVRFDVADLPKTPDDQFYQLCYCTAEKKTIVGVSAPIFFREVHEEELMEFQKELHREFWMFRSRFAVLTDIYWKYVEKNEKKKILPDVPEKCIQSISSDATPDSYETLSSNSESGFKNEEPLVPPSILDTYVQLSVDPQPASATCQTEADELHTSIKEKMDSFFTEASDLSSKFDKEYGQQLLTDQKSADASQMNGSIEKKMIQEKDIADLRADYEAKVEELQRRLNEKDSEISRTKAEVVDLKMKMNSIEENSGKNIPAEVSEKRRPNIFTDVTPDSHETQFSNSESVSKNEKSIVSPRVSATDELQPASATWLKLSELNASIEKKMDSCNLSEASASSSKVVVETDHELRSEINSLQEKLRLVKEEMTQNLQQSSKSYEETIVHLTNVKNDYEANIRELLRKLNEKDSEIARTKAEAAAWKKKENLTSVNLDEHLKVLKHLDEAHATYKKNMDSRLKACAKEYTKVYLKLRRLTQTYDLK